MRRPTLVRSAVVATAATLLVAGCGGGASSTSSKDPKAAFAAGLSGLTDTDALTMTFKLETTAANLMKLSSENLQSGDKALTQAQADKIAGGSFVLEMKTTNGKKISELKPGQQGQAATRFALVDNGTTYAEIRALSDALYAKADVKGLLDLFEQPPTVAANLEDRAKTMPPFVKAFVAGKWVSLDLNALKGLASQFGVQSSTSPQQGQKLLDDLRATLTADVTVTRVGTDDQGDHLKLTTDSKQLLGDLLQKIQADVPSAGLALSKLDATKIPAHSIVLDAWVNDGALSKLRLDVAQFASASELKPGDSLPIVLTFDRSGDAIDKPSDVTPVDLTQIGSLLGGLGG